MPELWGDAEKIKRNEHGGLSMKDRAWMEQLLSLFGMAKSVVETWQSVRPTNEEIAARAAVSVKVIDGSVDKDAAAIKAEYAANAKKLIDKRKLIDDSIAAMTASIDNLRDIVKPV